MMRSWWPPFSRILPRHPSLSGWRGRQPVPGDSVVSEEIGRTAFSLRPGNGSLAVGLTFNRKSGRLVTGGSGSLLAPRDRQAFMLRGGLF